MSFNVGINGFGRIGKSIVRIIEESSNSNIRIRAIKDFNNTNVSNEEYIKNMAYLLQNDSIYGKFPGKVDSDGKNLILSSHKILSSNSIIGASLSKFDSRNSFVGNSSINAL